MASTVYVNASGPITNVALLLSRFRQFFVQELRAVVIPRMKRLSRRRTDRLFRSWRVWQRGDRIGVQVVWYFDVQPNVRQMEREGRRLVLQSARKAIRLAFQSLGG